MAFYSTAETADTAYFIGGQETSNIVAKFTDNDWQLLPGLNKGRYGHGSIMVEDRILVIGGWTKEGGV